MAGIELVADRATKRPFPAAALMGRAVCTHARDLGAVLRPLGDVVVIMPPLAIEQHSGGALHSSSAIEAVCGASRRASRPRFAAGLRRRVISFVTSLEFTSAAGVH